MYRKQFLNFFNVCPKLFEMRFIFIDYKQIVLEQKKDSLNRSVRNPKFVPLRRRIVRVCPDGCGAVDVAHECQSKHYAPAVGA